MKILLAYDRSAYSDMAVATIRALELPAGTDVTVVTVVPEHTFLGGISIHMLRGEAPARKRARENQQQKAEELLHKPVQALKTSGLSAEGLVRWGNPAEAILKAAADSGAPLIITGAKGLADPPSFGLGSVDQVHGDAAKIILLP